jgi:hypothetical protein
MSLKVLITRCHGRGRGFEPRRPRHSFQKSCRDFEETIEDPKGHVFVPFFVPLFTIALKLLKSYFASELLTAATLALTRCLGDNFRLRSCRQTARNRAVADFLEVSGQLSSGQLGI